MSKKSNKYKCEMCAGTGRRPTHKDSENNVLIWGECLYCKEDAVLHDATKAELNDSQELPQ